MPLFQAQKALRLHAKRLEAKLLAGVAEGLPQVPGVRAWTMNLITKLADKTATHKPAEYPGDFTLAHAEVRKPGRGYIEPGQPAKNFTGPRPSEIHRRPTGSVIEHG